MSVIQTGRQSMSEMTKNWFLKTIRFLLFLYLLAYCCYPLSSYEPFHRYPTFLRFANSLMGYLGHPRWAYFTTRNGSNPRPHYVFENRLLEVPLEDFAPKSEFAVLPWMMTSVRMKFMVLRNQPTGKESIPWPCRYLKLKHYPIKFILDFELSEVHTKRSKDDPQYLERLKGFSC